MLWQPIPPYRTLYSPKGRKVKIFAIEIILSSLLTFGGPDSPSRGCRQPFLLLEHLGHCISLLFRYLK